jgi:hypothetical protein
VTPGAQLPLLVIPGSPLPLLVIPGERPRGFAAQLNKLARKARRGETRDPGVETRSNVSHQEFTSDVIKARAKIVAAAKAMLDGKLFFIEGARQILAWSEMAGLDSDEDILPFDVIESETDALPIGSARQFWNPEALERLQPEIEAAEKWARDSGVEHCHNLIRRFG